MVYIDGYVMPVPTENRDAYLEHIRLVATVFKEHGALSIVECWGAEVPDGEVTSMPMAVKLQPGETVVFGWIRWPSKEVHDAAWPKIYQDPRMAADVNRAPFDSKRMIFGGFDVVAEL